MSAVRIGWASIVLFAVASAPAHARVLPGHPACVECARADYSSPETSDESALRDALSAAISAFAQPSPEPSPSVYPEPAPSSVWDCEGATLADSYAYLNYGELTSRPSDEEREGVARQLEAARIRGETTINSMRETIAQHMESVHPSLKSPGDFTPTSDSDPNCRQMHAYWRSVIRSNMTAMEYAALSGYIGSDYSRINQVLRTGERTACLAPWTALIVRALRRLPVYRGTVWRGLGALPGSFFEAHSPGRQVRYSAFTSTSRNEDIAKSFAPGTENAILQINVRQGCRSLEGINNYEEEVLCEPGTRFRVLERAEGNRFIMAEVVPAPRRRPRSGMLPSLLHLFVTGEYSSLGWSADRYVPTEEERKILARANADWTRIRANPDKRRRAPSAKLLDRMQSSEPTAAEIERMRMRDPYVLPWDDALATE